MDRYILKTDGGSRGNPGPAGIGFVLTKNDEIICRGGTYIGETTNNVAEYHALIWGLENALDYEVGELSIRADSELVVRQINGSYKVKHPQLKLLFLQARSLLRQLNRYDIAHVPRGENANADALANEAMDARAQVGEPCKAYVIVADDAPTPDTPDIAEGSYHLSVKEHFDAAHHLYDYPGQCRNLHGHTWEVEVTVSGTRLDDLGMIYDFAHLKKDLQSVLSAYDHTNLNDVKPFDRLSPTAENLARIICEELQRRIEPAAVVREVAVWESPIARLAYRPL